MKDIQDPPTGRLYGNSHPTKIVEAQGWVVDGDGGIVLVAQAPSSQQLNT
ncbi:hypothetical protein [Iningainema tapete]|uniref:Uncharacterized protein n=1 Tax=Iningainema tapete BLCC-T55 TaxID=2748662 RepID=A0A8J7BXL7_9CYAN|nr:hypothetical protein [Iningainema tapete]MBD2773148.1 hypothetical protein [Iningainema tapete BLCC-T55]